MSRLWDVADNSGLFVLVLVDLGPECFRICTELCRCSRGFAATRGIEQALKYLLKHH